jgi:hypothetical protein
MGVSIYQPRSKKMDSVTTKYTKGPWRVEPSTSEIINVDHGRLPFAIVSGHTLIGATYENDADAQLIAAAPDLLEALQICEGNISSLLASNHPRVFSNWLDVVRAAIKKATVAA